MTDPRRIREYYRQFDEWSRLDSPEGQFILVRTLGVLERYLEPASRVLDLACGPGRYGVELIRRGHRLAMADLSPDLVRIAREKVKEAGVEDGVESIVENDAVDLSRYADASFDAVLVMGPLYHLHERDERERVVAEVFRVLRPGGHAFAEFVPRLTGTKWLINRFAKDPEQVTAVSFAETYRTGVFRNASSRGFQEGYYATADEVRASLAEVGFDNVDVLSVRSIASMHESALAVVRQENPELFAEVLAVVEATCRDPGVVALGGNALAVARKPTDA